MSTYEHDCGWLECTYYDCDQARGRASDEALRSHNIDHQGNSLGLPMCGDRRFNSLSTCQKAEGHDGFPRPGFGASHVVGGTRWRTFTDINGVTA